MSDQRKSSEAGSTGLADGPLVSALVVCYNHSRFVIECLEAVRGQTYRNLELIIVDDCSKDDSAAVIRGWLKHCPFPRQFVEHKENQGICRSLNDALSCAKGQYISMVAADDLWLPEKIEHQVGIMEQESEKVGVLYSDVYRVNEHGEFLPQKTYIAAHAPAWPPPTGDILDPLWRHGNWIPPMGTLLRRKCYDSVGGYDVALWHEDYDMWLRMAERFEFKFSDRISAKYRMVSTSMVRSTWPRICDSSVHMCLKHLARRDLPARVRPLLKQQLSLWAKRCFASGSPRYKSSMWAAAKRTADLKVIIPAMFALGGASFAQYQRAMNCFRRRSTHAAANPTGDPQTHAR